MKKNTTKKKSETAADRLVYFREHILQLNPPRMADALDIEISNYRKIENGTIGISADKMLLMVELWQLNLHWLLTGTGQIRVTGELPPNTLIEETRAFVVQRLAGYGTPGSAIIRQAHDIIKYLDTHKKK